MPEPPKTLHARFFRTANGREPVRDWLLELDREDRKRIGTDIKTVEFGWPIGMPVCRQLKGYKDLCEIRSRISNGRIARIIFLVLGEEMILLSGFIKKDEKTPKAELATAAERRLEFLRHASR
jgi:phage-related protein